MYLNMMCSSSNTPVFLKVNGSLLINFNSNWQLYFQYNVVEKTVPINHVLSKLCCWNMFCITFIQLQNHLHYTYHCKNCTTQECYVLTYTFPTFKSLIIVRTRFAMDKKSKITITIPFDIRPQRQSKFSFFDTLFHCSKHGFHMSITYF